MMGRVSALAKIAVVLLRDAQCFIVLLFCPSRSLIVENLFLRRHSVMLPKNSL